MVQSLWVSPIEEAGWHRTWTLFYWGWWISWAPFVGISIARTSYGRTIGEFVLGVLVYRPPSPSPGSPSSAPPR